MKSLLAIITTTATDAQTKEGTMNGKYALKDIIEALNQEKKVDVEIREGIITILGLGNVIQLEPEEALSLLYSLTRCMKEVGTIL